MRAAAAKAVLLLAEVDRHTSVTSSRENSCKLATSGSKTPAMLGDLVLLRREALLFVHVALRRVLDTRRLYMLALLAAVGSAAPAAPAAAQGVWPWQNDRPRVRVSRPAEIARRVPKRATTDVANIAARTTPAAKPAAVVKAPPVPLMAVISIGSQRVAIYDSTGAIMHAPISSGQSGHRTPIGVFSVIQKDRFHESNIYSGAPMPYMQRITWSGIAMHAGALPGYPASHGCIRMPDGFASKLFGMTRLGMRVVVAPHDTTPTAFSHPALPVPLMTPAPAGNEQAAVRQGAVPATTSTLVRVAELEGPASDAAPAGERLLNPLQRAQANKARSRAEAVAAVKAAKVALERAQEAGAEANAAVAELRAAEAAKRLADAQLVTARQILTLAATPEAQTRAAEAVAAAETRVADMTRSSTEAIAAEAVRTPEAFAAAVASREADELVETSEKLAKAADRAVEPVSVFISRKEGKLLVRQGFVPLFEAPVTFNGQAPLGTHLYVAMAAEDAAGQLKWLSVTVPNSSNASANADRAPVKRGQPAPADSVGRASSAAEALERVDIAPDVKAKLAERFWLGSSVIVSDLGISNETGLGTDFVVLTK